MKEQIDILGKSVVAGDWVACPRNEYAQLTIGKVLKITPKGMQVATVQDFGFASVYVNFKRATCCLKVDAADVPADIKDKIEFRYPGEDIK